MPTREAAPRLSPLAQRKLDAIVRDKLGFEQMRPGQPEALRSVLAKRDTLAVLPTGAGKSAIYQVAALMMDGPTVVVSPLIALQRDQLESIEDSGLAPVAVLNSTLAAEEKRETFAQLGAELEFLMLSPEQLANPDTLEGGLGQPSVRLDEAHASLGGHDFRPIPRSGCRHRTPRSPCVLALTATASPPYEHRSRSPGIATERRRHGFDRATSGSARVIRMKTVSAILL